MARVIAERGRATVNTRCRATSCAMLDGHRLVLRRRDSARIVERTRARRGTHNERRPYLVGLVLDHFRREYQRALVAEYRRSRERLDADLPRLPGRELQDGEDVAVAAALARGERPPPEWEQELTARVRRLPEVRAVLERMWPVLSGAELVHELFGFEALVRSAADDVLSPTSSGGCSASARPDVREGAVDRRRPPADRRSRRAARPAVGGAPALASAAQPTTRRSSRRAARSRSSASAVTVTAAQLLERYGADTAPARRPTTTSRARSGT